ncbi:DUF4256 domain-containing protein [Flaviaesturariibacter amylovorans]|uniref:DUF4256 domain-containing protein n=1 Tax=Flaviaesturariibacter amylovorans TaxID=1084520 RepID=A0ABP8G527_9BACT
MATTTKKSKAATAPAHEGLLGILKARFEKHLHRHPGIDWNSVVARLNAAPVKLQVLEEMERTGGEPDVVGADPATGALIFFDCAPETPAGRRSVCYDGDALAARREHKPAHSAVGMAEDMGIALLNEEQYRFLQALGPVDQKTSSWIATPPAMRKLGGALFGDYRYGQVFFYHNGVQSYYAGRGFRGVLYV